jgi:predicted phosphoribosyltransferase
MAGLAIGMIILGLIVAFAGLMVYLKVAHKTGIKLWVLILRTLSTIF